MFDRHGVFLGQLGGGAAGYGYWPVGDVPGRVVVGVLALEDRRFWGHPGVDPVAVARAVAQDFGAGRRVSGASTLAMQVARMQLPEGRTLGAKVMEAAAALVMTARYGRMGVLRQYLRLVPMGQDVHGIEAASVWYFDRPAADLSWAQIALLAAVPQAPGNFNLSRPAGLVRAKARAVLALRRLRAEGVIDAPTEAEALADLAGLRPVVRRPRPVEAIPAILLTSGLLRGQGVAQVHSTIDLALQAEVTGIAQARLASFRADGARQVAVMVVDRADMGVLALVGSGGYGPADAGEIDYAARWRSPGSTLKPFIYAQALAAGRITPASEVMDAADSGTEVENADRRFLGALLPAQALGNSRNVPAAALVRADGVADSLLFLDGLGLGRAGDPGTEYGLTLAIGAMPTTLARLVAAYGALANDGAYAPLRWYREQAVAAPRRVMPVAVARTVTLFLADPMARLPSFARLGATEFPFPVAVKTGTSQGFRDAWVVAFTDRYIVGVWVGRPDGQPMDGLTGAQSAALIGQDILLRLYPGAADGQEDGGFAPPPGASPVELCAGSPDGACAAKLVAYLPGGVVTPQAAAAPALRIVSPLNHSDFILNPDAPAGLAVLPLRVAAGVAGEVEWSVDGRAFAAAPAGATVDWPAAPGRHVFVAALAGAASRPVVVTVH